MTLWPDRVAGPGRIRGLDGGEERDSRSRATALGHRVPDHDTAATYVSQTAITSGRGRWLGGAGGCP